MKTQKPASSGSLYHDPRGLCVAVKWRNQKLIQISRETKQQKQSLLEKAETAQRLFLRLFLRSNILSLINRKTHSGRSTSSIFKCHNTNCQPITGPFETTPSLQKCLKNSSSGTHLIKYQIHCRILLISDVHIVGSIKRSSFWSATVVTLRLKLELLCSSYHFYWDWGLPPVGVSLYWVCWFQSEFLWICWCSSDQISLIKDWEHWLDFVFIRYKFPPVALTKLLHLY